MWDNVFHLSLPLPPERIHPLSRQPKEYLGACFHNVETLPGDSGSPMVAGRDELVGMRIGMLQETPETDFKPVCLNGRQILNYMLAVEMLSKRKGEFLGSDKPEILKARKTKASLLELYKKMSRGDYDDASITSSSSGASGGPRPLITRSETRLDHQKTQGNAFGKKHAPAANVGA